MLSNKDIFLLLLGVIFLGWLAGGLANGVDPRNGYVLPLPEEQDFSAGGCVISGCSAQLCIDEKEAGNFFTTCEYKEEYACYNTARCLRHTNGECGWEKTETLRSCVMKARGVN